jgi:hypothetical protein
VVLSSVVDASNRFDRPRNGTSDIPMTSVRDLEHPSTPLDATAPPLVALLTLGDEGWGVTPSIKINEGPLGGASQCRPR